MTVRMDNGHVIDTDRIFTADKLAPSMGAATYREWIHAVRHHSKLAKLIMKNRKIPDVVKGDPVKARVEHGRWVAHCDQCPNATENVTPNDKVFFCFSCMNIDNNFHLRPVVFPDDEERQVIETLLMDRKRHKDMGWVPGEKPTDLEKENRSLRERGLARGRNR